MESIQQQVGQIRRPEKGAVNNAVPFERKETQFQKALEEMNAEELKIKITNLAEQLDKLENNPTESRAKNQMIQSTRENLEVAQQELKVRPFIGLIEDIVKEKPTNAFETINQLNKLDQIVAQNPNPPSKILMMIEENKAELLKVLTDFNNPQNLETTGNTLTFPASESNLGQRISDMTDGLGTHAIDKEGKLHVFWHGSKGINEFGQPATMVNIDGTVFTVTEFSKIFMKKRLGILPGQEVTIHACYGGNVNQETSEKNYTDLVMGAKNEKTTVATYTDPESGQIYVAMGTPQVAARIPVIV